jgi:CHAT domain-containing protein/tetratricopeptide (TPR) repeat protein
MDAALNLDAQIAAISSQTECASAFTSAKNWLELAEGALHVHDPVLAWVRMHAAEMALSLGLIGEWLPQLERSQQSFLVLNELGDDEFVANNVIRSLHILGFAYQQTGQNDKAASVFEQALNHASRRYTTREDTRSLPNLVASYNNLASLKIAELRLDKAVSLLRSAATFADKLVQAHPSADNKSVRHLILRTLGTTCRDLGIVDEAISILRRITDECEEEQNADASDHPNWCETLNELAIAYSQKGLNSEAISALRKSRVASKRLWAQTRAALPLQNLIDALANLSSAYCAIGDTRRANASSKDAARYLRLLCESDPERDRTEWDRLALVIERRSDVFGALGNFDEAVRGYETALKIRSPHHQSKLDPKQRIALAANLFNLGTFQRRAGQFEASIATLGTARDHLRWISGYLTPERAASELIRLLNNLGNSFGALGRHADRINCLEEAVANFPPDVTRLSNSDLRNMATVLNSLGIAYRHATKFAESIAVLQRAEYHWRTLLNLEQNAHDREQLCLTLNSLGTAYTYSNQAPDAVRALSESVEHLRKIVDREPNRRRLIDLATSESNLGIAHEATGAKQAAFEAFRAALKTREALFREDSNPVSRAALAMSLNNLAAMVHSEGRALTKVLRPLRLAASILIESDDLDLAAVVFFHLAARIQDLSPPAAILFGKLSINASHELLAMNRGLPAETLVEFIRAKQESYSLLAHLLVREERLPEAQVVMAMIREEEEHQLWAYRGAKNDALKTHIALTSLELSEWSGAKDAFCQPDRTREDIQRYVLEISDPIPEVSEGSQSRADPNNTEEGDWLGALIARFEGNRTEQTRQTTALAKAEARKLFAYLEHLSQRIGRNVALVHLIPGDEQSHGILTTRDPGTIRSWDIKLTRAELNALIFAFCEALKRGDSDAVEYGEALEYRLLSVIRMFVPRSTVLLLSVSGSLRYLPFAALNDGARYLIEDFALAMYDGENNTQAEPPKHDGAIAAFGVTKPHGRFRELPYVEAELEAIVRSPRSPDGVLDGVILQDEAFTLAVFQEIVKNGARYVHIATHFEFVAGNEPESVLLMGDGTELTLGQLLTEVSFIGVELASLSACNTAVGGVATGEGRETTCLGTVIQRIGASSVLASLWPVEDKSTAVFMAQFYRENETAGLAKVLALQNAQLWMMSAAAPRSRRTSIPLRDRLRTFANPTVWAPFVLMGNPV